MFSLATLAGGAGSWAANLLKPFASYALMGSVAINVFLYFERQSLMETIEERNTEIVTLTQNTVELQETVNNHILTIADYKVANGALTSNYRHSQEKLGEVKSQLEDAKGRKHVALAKPNLVQKLANKATDKMFDERNKAMEGHTDVK